MNAILKILGIIAEFLFARWIRKSDPNVQKQDRVEAGEKAIVARDADTVNRVLDDSLREKARSDSGGSGSKGNASG